jgi:hypothetical protein
VGNCFRCSPNLACKMLRIGLCPSKDFKFIERQPAR